MAATTPRLQDVYQQAYSEHLLANARISKLYATTTETWAGALSKATTASPRLPTNVSSLKGLTGDSPRRIDQAGQASLGRFASLLALLWFAVIVPLFYLLLYITVCIGTVSLAYEICKTLGPNARRQLHEVRHHGSIKYWQEQSRRIAQRAQKIYAYYRWHRARDEALNTFRIVDRTISKNLPYLLLLVPAFLLIKAMCFPSAARDLIPWNELERFEVPWYLRIERRQVGSNHLAPDVHRNTVPRYKEPEIAVRHSTAVEAAQKVTLAATHTEYLITTVFKTVQASTALGPTCPAALANPISENVPHKSAAQVSLVCKIPHFHLGQQIPLPANRIVTSKPSRIRRLVVGRVECKMDFSLCIAKACRGMVDKELRFAKFVSRWACVRHDRQIQHSPKGSSVSCRMYLSLPSKTLDAVDAQGRHVNLPSHSMLNSRGSSTGPGVVPSRSSSHRSGAQNTISAKKSPGFLGSAQVSQLAPPPSPPPSTPPPAAPRNKGRRFELGVPRASTTPNLPVLTPGLPSSPETSKRARGPPPKRPPRPSSELFLSPMSPPIVRTLSPSAHLAERPLNTPHASPAMPPPAMPDSSSARRLISESQNGQDQRDYIPPLFSQSPNLKTGSASKLGESRIAGPSKPASMSDPKHHIPARGTDGTMASKVQELAEKGRERGHQAPPSTASSTPPETLFEFPIVPLARPSTAPPSLDRLTSRARNDMNFAQGPRSPGLKARHVSKASARSLDTYLLSATKKPALHRGKTASSLRAVLLDLDEATRNKRKAVLKPTRPPPTSEGPISSRRKKKGETMSMLLDTGFFPVKELIYGNGKATKMRESAMYRINLPPRLSFLEGDLPQTPSTRGHTPSELFQYSPSSPRRSRYRKSAGSGRSPLAQISENGSPGRDSGYASLDTGVSLAAIPEDSMAKENGGHSPGLSTPPLSRQIHLRGGSVVTVTPPELTAWKPTVYLHGPIKLLKPSIVPRKNSVASLEAFQEAVDQVYQHALAIPRRRSDDAVVDDICDFFDDFDNEMIGFGGEQFMHSVNESVDAEGCGVEEESEGFSTPPSEWSSDVAVIAMAREALSINVDMCQPAIPRVETEETLRERGIARLARLSRSSAGSTPGEAMADGKESLILGSLSLLPAPEDGAVESVLRLRGSGRGGSSVGYARSECSNAEEVQEIDNFEPAPISKTARNLAMRRTRNPIKKIKHAVALANAAL
ncbi:hypothetical protein AC578_542 [Pseudocercospora eumusae]|uniref:Uncharacterized protein n=1 Tax=Pseudocercospora eumusae TaxID=321146 RepID=A0A139HY96_9PEZI|nr:hypothetical protein AC578_542 [Pseudocercospora eumusae]